jgi:hypothetical protein
MMNGNNCGIQTGAGMGMEMEMYEHEWREWEGKINSRSALI